MGKLFQLALESSDLEGAVAPESTGPVLDESELEENVEESTQAQAEVEAGSEEVDQALEEVDALNEQIEANDAKLENPDEVVTTVDVEVSEEAYKKACYTLGIIPKVKLSFATESIAEDIRANPRKYLAVSNEDAKQVVKAIIDAVKTMIKKLGQLIKEVYTKISLKFANYAKRIDNGIVILKDIKNFDDEKIKERIISKNSAELSYALVNNKVIHTPTTKATMLKIEEEIKKAVDEAMKNDAALNKARGIESTPEKDAAMRESYEKVIAGTKRLVEGHIKLEDYGCKNNIGDEEVLNISGTKMLVSGENLGWKKETLEFDDAKLKSLSFDAKKLASDIISKASQYKKAISDVNSVLAEMKKAQKVADEMTIKGAQLVDPKAAKFAVYAIKSFGVTMLTFEMDRYIACIKAYNELIAILCTYGVDGKIREGVMRNGADNL